MCLTHGHQDCEDVAKSHLISPTFLQACEQKNGMDPWILDTNPWIIKAESHQHALGFLEVPTLVLSRFWGEHSVRDVLPNHLLIDISDPQGIVIGVMFTNWTLSWGPHIVLSCRDCPRSRVFVRVRTPNIVSRYWFEVPDDDEAVFLHNFQL